jgi:hypothetical protein
MSNIIFVAGGGIGNIVQATPTMRLIADAGHTVDLKLECNSSQDLEIFRLPFINKLYITDSPKSRYDLQLNGPFTSGRAYNCRKILRTRVSYIKNSPEAHVYADLATQIGVKGNLPSVVINVGETGDVPPEGTVAIYSGSKPNWAMKRWDKYDRLADNFENVTIIGTDEDIQSHGDPAWIKEPWTWGSHVQFFSKSLREAAYYISKCKMFIGNDGGLSHVAAATGIPTFVLFGPSADVKNKPFSPNAHVVAINLPCRPCQFKAGKDGKQIFGENRSTCPFDMKCMREMSVDYVMDFIKGKI